MQYSVMDSLMCPLTGTVFSGVITNKNLKLIIWYQGETIIQAGDLLSTGGKKLLVNGLHSDITIISVFPFNRENWTLLSKRTGCPANGAFLPSACHRPETCRFARCPYGLEKQRPDKATHLMHQDIKQL